MQRPFFRPRLVFRRPLPVAAGLLLTLTVTGGCRSMTAAQQGVLFGGGVGSAAGAIIGHQSGHTAGGALIGAAAGAVAGGLVGHADDMAEERDAAINRANYLEMERKVMTNIDIHKMIQADVSQDVIASSVRRSYGRYDLSPDAVITLKQCGVSDQVIIAMQQAPEAPPIPRRKGKTTYY